MNERLFVAGLLEKFDDALSAGDQDALVDLLVTVNADSSLATTLLGESYACWYCNESISKTKGSALKIGLKGLWSENPDPEPTQLIYAHFECANSLLKGATMEVEHEDLFPEPDDI
ncbi:hypothetical protein [Parasphingorhabdus sp.]|uniref:hypothetical protein n=1 Tax=Parasphingorhabdus sp. TaxID=2709688 RepID=UPI003265AB2E